MYEDGVWAFSSKLIDPKPRDNLPPKIMAGYIKRKALDRLGPYLGATYERAAARCLNGDFGVLMEVPVGLNLARKRWFSIMLQRSHQKF